MRTSRECEGVDKKKEGSALWSDRAAVQISVCETGFLPTLCIPAPHPSTFPEDRARFREDCQELDHEEATALCSPPTGRVSQGHLATVGLFINPRSVFHPACEELYLDTPPHQPATPSMTPLFTRVALLLWVSRLTPRAEHSFYF